MVSYEFRYAQTSSSILTLYTRATLTSKGGAFAAPFCFPDDKYSEGLNALGVRELALIEAYRNLGRPELADLVRTGRKYHRLFDVLFRECVTLTTLNALRRAFLGLPDGRQGLPQTLKEWIQVAKQNFSTDEHLEEMLERSEEFVKTAISRQCTVSTGV